MVLKIGKIIGKTNYSASNLPPGPWKLPFIGNLHQLIGSRPHHGLRDLAKKYGPLMHLKLGEVSTVVASSAEFAKEMMKTHDLIFASMPPILAAKILSYGSTNIGFAPYGSPINLTEEIYSSTYCFTSRVAFGKKTKDHEKFIYVVKEAVKTLSGFGLADVFPSVSLLQLLSGLRPKLERLHKEADRIMENIIKEHQRDMVTTKSVEGEAEEDLVDALLKFHEHGSGLEFSLTTDNIKAVIFDMFSAGSETSATAVDWAITEMIKNPRVMKTAQNEVREVFNRKGQIDETCIREMKYLNLVIRETLRLHPPIPLLLPRECGEKCEIDGYEIPVKSKVIVNAWAIGRDPNYWNEPERFNPNWFLDSSIDYKGTNFEYIPFGAGRRICPGISYGLANV
ncbi:hypothetical protein PRUPE_4G237900 [Prunus persica]|uniref:Uncharacterized protein n=1 Tax=Prunus persica TaxID=3760 RepID=A0A251PQ45_PRUPE|nr:hypothetical protein PRUPE_4G237900 [Prunus persica]